MGEDPDTGMPLYRSAWAALYRPVLSVLAVALAPLSIDQIRGFSGRATDRADLADALAGLAQFLDRTDNGFTLYHATVSEFLTAKTTRDQPDKAALYVDERHWHNRPDWAGIHMALEA